MPKDTTTKEDWKNKIYQPRMIKAYYKIMAIFEKQAKTQQLKI